MNYLNLHLLLLASYSYSYQGVKWIKEDRLPGSNKLKEDVYEGSFEHFTGDFRLVNKTVYCKPS